MIQNAILYVVATPIGNLGDITYRAVEILSRSDVIAAEDTRHSKKLLQHYNISTPMVSLHEHNEQQQIQTLLKRIKEGETVALISDAGTPLVSDPGYHLVKSAREEKLSVVPIPGPCAAIAAISVAGLPSDRFAFEGFLPAKTGPRIARLESIKSEPRTLIFYESPHRIMAMLSDLQDVLGSEREVVLARELTKTFETIHGASIGELIPWLEEAANRHKGELVLLVKGEQLQKNQELSTESLRILSLLTEELGLKKASQLTAKITGEKKNKLYEAGLHL